MMNTVRERTLIVHCKGPDSAAPLPWGAADKWHGQAQLWFSSLHDLRHRLTEFTAILDPSEEERAARFRFAVDRERFILAHGLLRTLLGELLGEAPEAVQMARGPYGKPRVQDTELHFNLSDTKDAVLIAFAQGQEVGADIETMGRTVDHRAVSGHYFTAEEIEDIRTATDDKRRFLELWTRKEAVLKASGVGIMDDLRVLRVNAGVNRMTITHKAFLEHAAETYHVNTWHLGKDHIISLASELPFTGASLRQP